MALYLVQHDRSLPKDVDPVFRFQNSGIVCLDRDLQTDSGVIVWTLMPKIG